MIRQIIPAACRLLLAAALFTQAAPAQSSNTSSQQNPLIDCTCFDESSISFPSATDDTTDPVKVPSGDDDDDGNSAVKIKIDLGSSSSSNSACSSSNAKAYVAIKGHDGQSETYVYGSSSEPEEFSIGGSGTETDEFSTDYDNYTVELYIKESDGTYTECQTKKFEFGCSSCSNGSCPTGSSNTTQGSSVKHTIMMGSSALGKVSLPLVFYSKEVLNPGIVALSMQKSPKIQITQSAGKITTVITDTTEAVISPVTRPGDPNAFQVLLRHRSAGLPGAEIQTTVFENVGTGSNMIMRFSTTRGSKTEVVEFQKTNDATGEYYYWSTLIKDNGLKRETIKKKRSSDGSINVVRTIEEELKANGTSYEVVSDIEETYQGGRKVKHVIDPDGTSLTSTWQYWGIGEDSSVSGNGSTLGQGQVRSSTNPNGLVVEYFYEAGREITHESYAGDSQGLITESTTNLATGTTTVTRKVGNSVVSMSKTASNKNDAQATTIQTINTTYSDASNYLETSTVSYPPGQQFGGKPFKTLHADGTVTLYQYNRTPESMTTTTLKGAANASGISEGTKTVSVANTHGQIESEITTSVSQDTSRNGLVLSQMVVLSSDEFGRALSIGHFPDGNGGYAYTNAKTYSCCGVATETDRYGITTTYAYDDLKRVVKTNRLGVTTATLYDGLSQSTHRFPESAASAAIPDLSGATDANMISKTVRNLAGTITESWSRSAADGTLIRDTLTTTTYLNPESATPATTLPAGIGMRQVVETVDGFKQTTDFYPDGKIYQTKGTLKPEMQYAYGVNATGEWTSQSYLDGTILRETTTTQTDWAGRQVRVDYMGGAFATMHYNAKGQMVKSVDPDSVTTLYAYNDEGERTTTAIDLNANGVINYGSDQVTASLSNPAIVSGRSGQQTITQVWQDGASAGTTASTSFRSSDGLYSSSQSIGVGNPSISLTSLSGNGNWTITQTNPDNTMQVQTYTAGRLASAASLNSSNQLIESISYGYDSHGRPGTSTHSRTGATVTAYRSAVTDVVASVTDPGGRVTSFTYDSRGRRTHVDAPNTFDPAGAANNTNHANITITAYNPDGTVQETTGGQTYRVTYGYDYAQRRNTMTTYGTHTATTTWIYSPNRGFLVEKNYAGETNNGPGNAADYTYTAAGRIKTRTWERGVVTTYYYDAGGRQLAINYSDSTPDVIFEIDALGRIKNQGQGTLAVTNGVPSMASPIRSISNTYDPNTLRLESETHNLGGITRTLVRSHDAAGRPEEVTVGINTDSNPATLETTDHYTGYFYGNDGRLLGIDAKDLPRFNGKDYGIEYTYTANSVSLIHTLTRAGSSSNIITTHTWDSARDAPLVTDNRLDGAPNPVSQFAYTVNALGQRDKVETVGTAFGVAPVWKWSYNPRGELVSARDTSANNRDLGYVYDAIGNRVATGNIYSVSAGVEQVTNPVAYTPNAHNQYSVAAGVTLPSTPAPAPYDLDGNLRFDGGVNKNNEAREYVWDGENRLIEVLNASGQSGVSLVTYAYDSQSRRISRTDETAGSTTSYVYDGWNVISEYTGSTPALARTYTWGTDLSGTMQGAGGVGGLLAVRSGGINYSVTYDGNGNVSEYLTEAGIVAAHFEYDPFGNLTGFTEQSQGLAASFAYRFSTKPVDEITGWLYYLYRYYDPVTGRWPSRDPIEENGGINLYGFVMNNSVNNLEVNGLFFGTGADVEGYVTEHLNNAPQAIKDFFNNNRDYGGHNDMENHSQEDKGCSKFDYTKPDQDRKGKNEWHFIEPGESETKLNTAISNCDADEFQDRMHGMQDWYIHKDHMANGHIEELYALRNKRAAGQPQRYYEIEVTGNKNSVYWLHPDVVPKGGVLKGGDDAPWNQADKATGDWIKKWEEKCCCKRKKWDKRPANNQ